MVFVSPDLWVKNATRPELGYKFALPRLLARSAGRKVRRAQFSAGEAYSLGLLVFGLHCVFAARAILPFVRTTALQALALLFLPFAIWIAFLFLYYMNSLVLALLRRAGLFAIVPNNQFQHVVISTLTTLIALAFLREESSWIRSLGVLWLALLAFNLFAIVLEKFLDES